MHTEQKKEIGIFCIIFLLAVLLRLLFLGTIPSGFHGDEGWTIIEAKRILHKGFIGFWSEAALGQAAFPYYWTALFFMLFGDSIFTTRLSFTLLTLFSIPFFYLAVRILFSKNIALITTLLFCTSSTILAFSRRADFIAMSFPFFPAVFFFWKALKTGNVWNFVFAGIFIGLLHHVYAGFWIAPILFFAFLSIEFIHRKFSFIKKNGKNLVIFLLCYLLIASPMFIFAYTHQQDFFSRSKMVSIFSSTQNFYTSPATNDRFSILLHNLQATLLMFNLTHDPDSWNIFSATPVLDIITGIFFILGLFLSLKDIKKKEVLFVYLFFLFFLSGSILTIDAPNYRRAQVSIFFSFIFAAIGMRKLYLFLKTYIPYGKKFIYYIGLILLFGICIFNIQKYFKDAQSPEAKYILAFQLVKISDFVKKVPGQPYVYFFSSRWSYKYETLQGLLGSIQGEDRSTEFGKLTFERTDKNKTAIFILLPEYITHLTELNTLYPHGESIIHKDISGNILFISFVVPRQSTE